MKYDKWSSLTGSEKLGVLNNEWSALDSGYYLSGSTITYSFLTSADNRQFDGYIPSGEALNFVPLNEMERAYTNFIFDYLSSFLNVEFTQAFGNSGQLGFGKHNMIHGGYADYPRNGDMGIFLDSKDSGEKYGEYIFGTITHELGHALGLSHPADYSGNGRSNPTLTADLDTAILTQMSYNNWFHTNSITSGYSSAFAPLDIYALQKIYGTDTSHENNIFRLTIAPDDVPSRAGTVWNVPVAFPFVVVDTGGYDTIDASATLSASSSIEAYFSFTEGLSSSDTLKGEIYENASQTWLELDNANALTQIQIAAGTIIEEYIGTQAKDIVDGNILSQTIRTQAGNDQIFGRGGDDTIDGGTGVDTAQYSGLRSIYSVKKNADGFLSVNGGADGTDTLINIEKLQFSDRAYNLEAAQKATTIGTASLNSLIDLYVAYFNRVPEASGLIYWIDQIGNGKSLDAIASEFYAAGIQNSAVTGYTSSMPLSDFIGILYQNVLGRTGDKAPSPEDTAYWENEVATGAVTREGMVARFLGDARKFYDDPDVGFVPLLLDQKIAFGKLHAVTYGVDYNDTATSIQKTVELAATVTPTSIDAAVQLVGLNTDDYIV